MSLPNLHKSCVVYSWHEWFLQTRDTLISMNTTFKIASMTFSLCEVNFSKMGAQSGIMAIASQKNFYSLAGFILIRLYTRSLLVSLQSVIFIKHLSFFPTSLLIISLAPSLLHHCHPLMTFIHR